MSLKKEKEIIVYSFYNNFSLLEDSNSLKWYLLRLLDIGVCMNSFNAYSFYGPNHLMNYLEPIGP